MFKPQLKHKGRMRLNKPVYDGVKKVWTCDIKEAGDLQYTSDVYGEPSAFTKTPASFFDETLPACVTTILSQTLGWFSKPLTEEWLIQKLTYSIPTESIPNGFDGRVEYTPVRLHIYKEGFVVEYKLTDTKENEKVCINFQEDEEAKTTEAEATQVDATEADATQVDAKAEDEEKIRHEMKQKVLQARQRAARALFKAEELMHTFVEKYGMDTDWEDEDD
jgi:hypothetical protein